MFERKLIRHPYGHEEVLIVDGAVLRPHDLPDMSLIIWMLLQRAFGAIPEVHRAMEQMVKEKIRAPRRLVHMA